MTPDEIERVAAAAWYAARKTPARIQVAPLEERGALDVALARAGWEERMRVDVLTAAVADVAAPAQPVPVLGSAAPRWLDAWARAVL
ncbi:MAG: hypothetical protein M3417_04975, partial [Actinomycetota bacterium]|nr:hypothetical protein [Actinomycetota bacterium]